MQMQHVVLESFSQMLSFCKRRLAWRLRTQYFINFDSFKTKACIDNRAFEGTVIGGFSYRTKYGKVHFSHFSALFQIIWVSKEYEIIFVWVGGVVRNEWNILKTRIIEFGFRG